MKIFALSLKKLRVMFGGRLWLLPLCLLALIICFAAYSSAMTAKSSPTARVAVFDRCGGEYSKKLTEGLGASAGFELSLCETEDEAYEAVLDSRAEAVLIINENYDRELTGADANDLVEIFTAPGSVTAELIRETLAGRMIAQRSYKGVSEQLEIEGFDPSLMEGFMDEFDAPVLYTVNSMHGGAADTAVFGRGFPGYEGFAGLALMLMLLTLSHRFCAHSSRLVSVRMNIMERGWALDIAADLIAVFTLALLFGVPAFALAPNRSPAFAAGLVAYAFMLSALCVLLSRVVSSGRLDIASPLAAFLTSLFGGCFGDLAALSPALAVISKLTPQGQLIAAAQGNLAFAAILIVEGAALITAAALISKRKRI
ncbi:MAG: ABC transporter permease [Clostridia bacterium]|nr:ABC transporter permease [Clostridia bacterium]